MQQAMSGKDVVIHNAGMYKFGITREEQASMHIINVQGTENTLGLAIELGISRVVYISTILVYGPTGEVIADETFQRRAPPLSWYERTKTEAHELAVRLQQQGAPIVIACPAGVIGPGDHSGLGYLARMYVRGLLPPVLFAANGRRAHVHVVDAAEGILRCVTNGRIGQSYILSDGVLQHRELVEIWKQTPGGIKTTLMWMPDSMALLFNRMCEPFERLLGLPMVFCREFALNGFAGWQFTAAKAQQELGVQFREVEQAWLDTLEAERALVHSN
jgi:dihydroflavonol-4-reductase